MGHISPLLAARDIKETIRFYTEKLGFTVRMTFPTADNPEYVDLSKDGVVLMFIPVANMGVDAGAALGVGVNLYIEIDSEIDAYYGELRGKGVKLVEDIKDEPFGIRDFTIEDTDGYKLTFSRPIGKNCMSCGMPMVKLEDATLSWVLVDFLVNLKAGEKKTFSLQKGRGRKPKVKLEDFGGGSPASIYCQYCSNPDGSLKSYEDVLNGVTGFMMSTQGLDRAAAESKAKEHLAAMPAWSGG